MNSQPQISLPARSAPPIFGNDCTSLRNCSKCKRDKPKTQFFKEKRGAEGLRYSCKDCDRKRRRSYHGWKERATCLDMENARKLKRDWTAMDRMRYRARYLIRGAQRRSADKHLPFDLNQYRDEIQARVDAGFCELSGIRFDLSEKRGFASPSIDRIRPELGYVYNNVRVVCQLMNCALGDWGEERLLDVMRVWGAKRNAK